MAGSDTLGMGVTRAIERFGRDILAIRRDCLADVGQLLGHPDWA